jgi:hypothetical protein
MPKQNRTRNVQLIVRVTEQERDLIRQKMRLIHTDNFSAYIRKMAIDGYIIIPDYGEIKNHSVQLQKIGNNVNQIVKRMNMTGSLYQADVTEIKAILHDIWLSERQFLLKVK